jgi:Holliday junction resolvase RusA-like endonuclease
MNMNFETLKAILDDIQKDLADFQNQKGIGMMDDNQWADLFIERVTASITTYEDLKEK